MNTLILRKDHITLAHAVKAVGLAGSGGQAKTMVRDGCFTVNGQPETRPGRKLFAGDHFSTTEGNAWEMRTETSEG